MDDLFDASFEEEFSMSQLAAGELIDQKYIQCLMKSFGFSNFRPFQWKIISSVMERKQDVLAIMATGYGKSLCFQFPSVYLNTITLVVSPLISLMEDQVMSLTLSNIDACFLGSAQKDRSTYQGVLNGNYRLVYLTPELLTSDFGDTLLQSIHKKLTMIAIDEAHCISKWGHDFRSAFRYLGGIRKKVPGVPILALTATATPQVRQDIITSLGMKNAEVVCTGFDRPNLQFHVSMKSKEGVWHDIGNLVRSSRLGSTIIYCLTRKQTEEIALLLEAKEVPCAAYHAGLSIGRRKEVHEDFVRDRVRVIVATIAFGMGIDKPDVRLVIHYGASKDLESYYQEIGRAGRDGLASKCHMFYSHGDFQIHSGLRSLTSDAQNKNLEVLSMKMREYINTTECRRWFILQYFEGAREKPQPALRCCDNCFRKLKEGGSGTKYEGLDTSGFFDFSKDAELFLKSIEVFGGSTGLQIPIFFLRGSKNQKINRKLYDHALHGSGKHKSEDWWKSMGHLLEEQGFLKRHNMQRGAQSFRVQTVGLTRKAEDWLENGVGKPLLMMLPKDMYSHLKVKREESLQERAGNLKPLVKESSTNASAARVEIVKALMMTRLSLASEFDVMPYMICSNRAIFQMANVKPMNLEALRKAQLDGFSDVKVEKFGSRFIKCIQSIVGSEETETQSKEKATLLDFLREYPVEGVKIFPAVMGLLEFWRAGKNINEICQLRGIAASTAMSYMTTLAKAGYLTKLDLMKLGVSKEIFNKIESKIHSEPDIMNVKLKTLKDKCPASVTWDQLKLVLSYCQLEHHVKSNGGNLSELQAALEKSGKEESQEIKTSEVKSKYEPVESTSSNKNEEDEISFAAKYLNDENDFDFSHIDIPDTKTVSHITISGSEDEKPQNSSKSTDGFEEDIKQELKLNDKVNDTIESISDEGNDELDKLILAIKEDELGKENSNVLVSQVEPIKEDQQPKKRILKRKKSPEKIVFLASSSDEDEPTRSKFFPKKSTGSVNRLSMKSFKRVEL